MLGVSGSVAEAALQSCEVGTSPVASLLGKLRQGPHFLYKEVPGCQAGDRENLIFLFFVFFLKKKCGLSRGN